MGGDICIDRNQITSYYINRDTYINVEVVEHKHLQHRPDSYLNIYPSLHSYNYPYLLEYIKIFQ